MKHKIFISFFFVAYISAYAQQTPKTAFPKALFADSTQYPKGFAALADIVIPAYSDKDTINYLDNIFRIYAVQGDYTKAIKFLDNLDVKAMKEGFPPRAIGFQFRAYYLAQQNLQKDPSGRFTSVYPEIFAPLYLSLDEHGKIWAKKSYEDIDPASLKTKLYVLIDKQVKNNTDSIDLESAISLLRQYNSWQTYSVTADLARAQFDALAAQEKAQAEEKLLGLDEGATLSPGSKTFITNVTLVDVEKHKLIPNVTVSITGNKITAISTKLKNAVLQDAMVIDGAGKFLLPGMTDAHIHFFQSGGIYTRPDGLDLRRIMPYENEISFARLNFKDVLKRNIINGITTVVDVGATNNLLQLREKFKGKSFAPDVYMTGALLTTYEPPVFQKLGNDAPFTLMTTEEEARAGVRAQLPYHPDFIKIWYIIEGSDKTTAAKKQELVVKAAIEEAHQNNLKVAVHAMESITAEIAVRNGADYLVHSVTDEVLTDDFIKLLKERNVTLCPTLEVGKNYNKVYSQQYGFSLRELEKSNPQQLGSLFDLKHISGNNEKAQIDFLKDYTRKNISLFAWEDSISLVNLKKLADAGVRIVAGTDAGNTGTLHGTTFLQELLAMKKSGISNWQVLQSATINPAFIMNKQKETGSIAAGKTADLVLLNANPVEDLQNLDSISLVINKGFVINPDTLIRLAPADLVQQQLNAYNARNLEAFLEPYADDAELYDYKTGELQTKGKDAMRKAYAFFNDVPDLHCEIKERIVQGNIVIDKEHVTGFGALPLEATAIYHIENNKIKKVYFIQ
ncbi:MAG: amidohydrolase family protein [Chitinophagaceae bacterium]|nr:amidohydrolase family protein [Chitinophagaceae bacterium]